MTVKIGINGFGRIGRAVFRATLENPDIEVIAINDLMEIKTLAHLLKYDSVHGNLKNDIRCTKDSIIVDDRTIVITARKDPAQSECDHNK